MILKNIDAGSTNENRVNNEIYEIWKKNLNGQNLYVNGCKTPIRKLNKKSKVLELFHTIIFKEL